MNHELAELYDEPSILTVAKAGASYEDAGLMPHQEGVRQRSLVWHKAQGRTASSMTASGEARPVGDRMSIWMGGCSQVIVEIDC